MCIRSALFVIGTQLVSNRFAKNFHWENKEERNWNEKGTNMEQKWNAVVV
jgi:hypothetical protein